MDCKHHSNLERKIDEINDTQVRLVTLLEETVVKKDQFYQELTKMYDRSNTDYRAIKSALNTRLGILTGILVTLGGALAAVLKTL